MTGKSGPISRRVRISSRRASVSLSYRRYPAALRQQGNSRPWSEYQRTVLTVTAAHRASSPVVRYPATSPLMGPSLDPYVTAQSITLAAPAESEIPATAGCVVRVVATACNWPCHQVNWCWRGGLAPSRCLALVSAELVGSTTPSRCHSRW